ncbi:MAG: DedA family protein [Bdellovibrionales bacterium]|nr:DedA family protein [Bdellovibrionales bacterium]
MRTTLLSAVGPNAYPVFFGLLISGSLGMPVNSDTLLILGAVLAATGHLDIQVLIIGAPMTILAGDTINFFIARKHGKKILATRFFRRWVSIEKQAQIQDFATRHGAKCIFMTRFTPLLRAVTFFISGSVQVKPKTFFAMNGLATWIYVPSLLLAVYFTASHLQEWVDGYQVFVKGALTATGLALFYFLAKWASRRWMENGNAS